MPKVVAGSTWGNERGRSRPARRDAALLLALLLLALPVPAFAYDGFTVGLAGTLPSAALASGGGYVLVARAVYPVADLPVPDVDVQLGVRGDVSYAIGSSSLPALSATVLVASRADDLLPQLEGYLGGGIGLTFPGGSFGLTAHFLAGVRLPIVPQLFGVAELQVVGAGGGLIAPGISFGIEYTFAGGF